MFLHLLKRDVSGVNHAVSVHFTPLLPVLGRPLPYTFIPLHWENVGGQASLRSHLTFPLMFSCRILLQRKLDQTSVLPRVVKVTQAPTRVIKSTFFFSPLSRLTVKRVQEEHAVQHYAGTRCLFSANKGCSCGSDPALCLIWPVSPRHRPVKDSCREAASSK